MGFNFLTNMYQMPGTMIFSFAIVFVWTIIWKGLGLWYTARYKQKGWFIAMLLLNTMGLLPIIYLLWFKPNQRSIIGERPTIRAAQSKSKLSVIKKKNK